MKKTTTCLCLLCVFALAAAAAGPYAPAAGKPGTTAVHKDDAAFAAWATGYVDYVVGTNVDAQWQTPARALGKAVGDSYDIVSLGNGGRITLTFAAPITNGPGWDFAAFENGITDGFLELGYVEVSSDGANFFRFPNHSLTASPVGAYGSLDPTNLDGYCSKYRQGYGTPFDLSVLQDLSPLLDITRITHVRIVDIVGDGTYFDSDGHVLYDPHPTTGSAGVDLDAVGVRYQLPEPATLTLLATALATTTGWFRRRPQQRQNHL